MREVASSLTGYQANLRQKVQDVRHLAEGSGPVGQFLAMAAGLTVFCLLIFLKGLGVPLPILGSWFGR